MTRPADEAIWRGPNRWITIAIVLLVTIVAFEFMAISTAMPAVAADLDAVTTYGLAFSVMLTTQLLGIVLAGVWCDRAGPLPSLYVGQLAFAIGAVICALAPTFAVLLVGRAVTGLGAGMAVVALYVVIGRAYPETSRPRVFTAVSAAWVLPSMIGAPAAGYLASHLSWRSVFWVVVLPAVATLAILRWQQPRLSGATSMDVSGAAEDLQGHDAREHRRAARFGALLAIGAGLIQWATRDPAPLVSVQTGAAVLGVATIVLSVRPLVPRGTLTLGRGLPSVINVRFLLNAAFNGSITYLPLYLVREREVDLASAGWLLALGSFGWSFGSWVQARPVFAGRRERAVWLGAASLTVGVSGLALAAAGSLPIPAFVVAMVFAGFGMGIGSTTLSVLVLDLSTPRDQGSAASSLQLADVLGSVVGIAACSALFVAGHGTAGDDTRIYVTMWSVLAVVAAIGIVGGARCRPADQRASR